MSARTLIETSLDEATSSASASAAGARITWGEILVEWGIILISVLAFSLGFLDLGTRRPLRGTESEIFQSLDWVLANSLSHFGQFPLWNPYIKTGLPLIADPFLHAYNPFVTLPVLALGVWDGFKVGLFLSFFAAALGGWWLGKLMGLGRVSRVWLGLMYAFAGQGVARFFQGEYDFVLGFAWIPWIIAGFFAVAQTKRKIYVAVTAVSLALLFFSGNVYYAYYILFVVPLAVIVLVLDVRTSPRSLKVDLPLLRTFIVVGLLAFALVAIQLLPLLEFLPHTSKVGDSQLAGSHTLNQIWLDLTSTEALREDTHDFPQETYAYIGLIPVLAIILLPLAWLKQRRRPLVFFILLLFLSLLWIDARDTPLAAIFERLSFLSQFRYPTRFLIFTSLAILSLAALGLDSVFKFASSSYLTMPFKREEGFKQLVPLIGVGLTGAVMLFSLAQVFTVNKEIVITFSPYDVAYQVSSALKSLDSSPFYVSTPYGWNGALASNDLRFLDSFYGFTFNPDQQNLFNNRTVEAQPNYLILEADRQVDYPNPQVTDNYDTLRVYRLPHSLPYAFAVADAKLQDSGAPPLANEDVTNLPSYVNGPNSIEFITEGQPASTLVVLTSIYNGWKVFVDGHEQPLRNVGGFLATAMQPGAHKYVFAFDSNSFKFGALVSLVALILVLGLIVGDIRDSVPWDVLHRQFRRISNWRIRGLSTSIPNSSGMLPVVAASTPAVSVSPINAESGTLVQRHHLAIMRAEGKFIAQVQDLGKYQSVRFSVALPGGWAGSPDAVSPSQSRRFWSTLTRAKAIPWLLFFAALGVFALTRLFGLTQFPIYFFTDEAIHPNLAAELIQRGFRGPDGELFPPYFQNGVFWNLSLSVYIHAVTVALLGKSILVTRATSVVFTILGAAAVGLTMKLIFNLRWWWIAVLFLAITPAWFLHSRTAFETALMVSFYSGFLLCYLLYRYRSPNYLYPAIILGAATFYSYANGQAVMGVSAILLALSDWRYHVKNVHTIIRGLVLGSVLLFPYLRFRIEHPEEVFLHLRWLDSYWLQRIPLEDKVTRFVQNYAYGLSPQYWFLPNEQDLIRHRMSGYGHILWWVFPFAFVGFIVAIRNFRESKMRAVLIAMLAAPFSSALADILVTRTLLYILPVAILTTLGFETIVNLVKSPRLQQAIALGAFLMLSFTGVWMLRDALVNGPIWFDNYGLYGMQWGAKELFSIIPEYLNKSKNTTVLLSPTWANGTDQLAEFFLPNDSRFEIKTIDAFMDDKLPLNKNMVFIMTSEELPRVRASKKFKPFKPERVVNYPDGTPGFYFARLEYVNNIDQIFDEEIAARRKPVTENVDINGESVMVTHSLFDSGQAQDMFDGDTFTLARGMEANPLVVELNYISARPLSSLSADFGRMNFSIKVSLFPADNGAPVVYTQEFRQDDDNPHADITFANPPPLVQRARIEITNLDANGDAKIHVRELNLK